MILKRVYKVNEKEDRQSLYEWKHIDNFKIERIIERPPKKKVPKKTTAKKPVEKEPEAKNSIARKKVETIPEPQPKIYHELFAQFSDTEYEEDEWDKIDTSNLAAIVVTDGIKGVYDKTY